jgi:hypothetical protein
MRLFISLLFISSWITPAVAQEPDMVLMPNIKTAKLFQQNNQTGYPIINLDGSDLLELHFDDMEGRVKNYFYTYQLCDVDWKPVNLSVFDYLKGFTQARMTQYRVSAIAYAKYIHYQAVLPERNCVPSKSGNYLLKVFLDGDTSKLAFTKRLLVLDNKASVAAQILQPFNAQLFRTHQKVQFSVNKTQLNVINPQQQIKVVILQNFRWDNARRNIQPTFIRSNMLEFNTENDCLFPAGKEYRWADLRSFRFSSDRVSKKVYTRDEQSVQLVNDGVRAQQRFINFRDYNGFYFVDNTDNANPWWQSDYADVTFTFVPSGNQPYPNKRVFIMGELTGNNVHDTAAMNYNAEKGVYEKTISLKQAYYSYTYVTKDAKNRYAVAETQETDGDNWETENDYTVLIYYRSLAGRHDELVGVTTVNSLNTRRNF